MKQEELQKVIESLRTMFSRYGSGEIEFSTPYSVRDQDPKDFVRDYSGIITLTGQNIVGAAVISFPKEQLYELTKQMLGGVEPGDDMLADNAGELANTIAGLLQKDMTQPFAISTPIVIKGDFEKIELPKLKSPMYIFPFSWNGHQLLFGVGYDEV